MKNTIKEGIRQRPKAKVYDLDSEDSSIFFKKAAVSETLQPGRNEINYANNTKYINEWELPSDFQQFNTHQSTSRGNSFSEREFYHKPTDFGKSYSYSHEKESRQPRSEGSINNISEERDVQYFTFEHKKPPQVNKAEVTQEVNTLDVIEEKRSTGSREEIFRNLPSSTTNKSPCILRTNPRPVKVALNKITKTSTAENELTFSTTFNNFEEQPRDKSPNRPDRETKSISFLTQSATPTKLLSEYKISSKADVAWSHSKLTSSGSSFQEQNNENETAPRGKVASPSTSPMKTKSFTPKKYPSPSPYASVEAIRSNNTNMVLCPKTKKFVTFPKNSSHHSDIETGLFDDLAIQNDFSGSSSAIKVEGNGGGYATFDVNAPDPSAGHELSECTITEILTMKSERKITTPRRMKELMHKLKPKKKAKAKASVEGDNILTRNINLGVENCPFKVAEGFSSCTQLELMKFVKALQKGYTISIYNKNNIKKQTIYLFHENHKYLMIGSPRNSFDLSKCVEVRYALSSDPACPDQRGTPTLRKLCHNENLAKSFSIIFRNGTIDLTAEDSIQCNFLAKGFSALCVYIQLEKMKKLNQLNEVRKR